MFFIQIQMFLFLGTPVDSNEKRCYANAAFVREELQRSLMISDAPERDVETADKPQSHVLHAARDPLPAGAVFGATNALAQISPQPGSDVRYFYQQNTGTFFRLLLALSSKDSFVCKVSKK